MYDRVVKGGQFIKRSKQIGIFLKIVVSEYLQRSLYLGEMVN